MEATWKLFDMCPFAAARPMKQCQSVVASSYSLFQSLLGLSAPSRLLGQRTGRLLTRVQPKLGQAGPQVGSGALYNTETWQKSLLVYMAGTAEAKVALALMSVDSQLDLPQPSATWPERKPKRLLDIIEFNSEA